MNKNPGPNGRSSKRFSDQDGKEADAFRTFDKNDMILLKYDNYCKYKNSRK